MFRSRAQGEVTSREAARKIFSRASVERLDRNRKRGTLDNQNLEVRRLTESWNIFHAAPIIFCSVLCSSSLWVDQRAISLNPGIVTTSTYILHARVSVVNQLCEFRKQNFKKLIIIIAKVLTCPGVYWAVHHPKNSGSQIILSEAHVLRCIRPCWCQRSQMLSSDFRSRLENDLYSQKKRQNSESK